MKKFFFGPLIFLLVSVFTYAQEAKKSDEVCYNPNLVKDTSKRSIKSAAISKIGQANVTINYHSPGVRKRIIWGGLVPYGEVWVTGAHDATTLEIDREFKVGGKTIPAGKYAFFTIPDKNEWVVIVNKQWKQHLATEYDKKEDVIRIKVKPVKQAKSMERLQYFIKNATGNKGTIAVAWEKLKVEFGVTTL